MEMQDLVATTNRLDAAITPYLSDWSQEELLEFVHHDLTTYYQESAEKKELDLFLEEYSNGHRDLS